MSNEKKKKMKNFFHFFEILRGLKNEEDQKFLRSSLIEAKKRIMGDFLRSVHLLVSSLHFNFSFFFEEEEFL